MYSYIKNKILNNRRNKYGYILSNFPQTIEQAQYIFNLEQIDFQKENTKQILNNEKYPSNK